LRAAQSLGPRPASSGGDGRKQEPPPGGSEHDGGCFGAEALAQLGVEGEDALVVSVGARVGELNQVREDLGPGFLLGGPRRCGGEVGCVGGQLRKLGACNRWTACPSEAAQHTAESRFLFQGGEPGLQIGKGRPFGIEAQGGGSLSQCRAHPLQLDQIVFGEGTPGGEGGLQTGQRRLGSREHLHHRRHPVPGHPQHLVDAR
jgi:hypothetical protein